MSKKILIVDDEPNIVVPLEYLMEQNNYEVKIAETGERVLELIASFNPDLILLDIMLPGMDGYEVCQTIRQDPSLNDTKIVFLSAMARTIDIARGMGLAADEYITKPVRSDELLVLLKLYLEKNEG